MCIKSSNQKTTLGPLCTVGIGSAITMKNSMEAPQKIKNRTTIKSSNSISGCLPEENKSINSKRYIYTLCPL